MKEMAHNTIEIRIIREAPMATAKLTQLALRKKYSNWIQIATEVQEETNRNP